MAKIRLLKETLGVEAKVIYSSKALKQLKTFMSSTHARTYEFLFLGYVERKDMSFFIKEFFLVPQAKCSATYCETDDDRYPDWIAKNIPMNKRNKLRIHGHSHVNMMTSPSGVDNTQLTRLIDEVDDYFVQLIINHQMNYTVNIWLKKENIVIENATQYLEINNYILPLVSNTLKVEIKDGNKEIKNGIIQLDEVFKFDFINNMMYTEDENLLYKVGQPDIQKTVSITINQQEVEEINKIMVSMIKTNYIQTTNYSKYSPPINTDYSKKKVVQQNWNDLEDEMDDFYVEQYGGYYGLK